MGISERIAAIRKEMHLNQEKFGALVGMSQRSVAAWEAGERIPSYDVLIELSDKLGVSVDYIMGRSDSRLTKKEPAVNDSGLTEKIISRIQELPDPALARVSDFLDGLEAGRETEAALAAGRDPVSGSAG